MSNEKTEIDFQPQGRLYLAALLRAIEQARHPADTQTAETLIAAMRDPAVCLKQWGAVSGYQLVTRAADILIEFLGAITTPDEEAIEIALAFHTTIRIVMSGRLSGDGGKHGEDLMQALEAACRRYFGHRPDGCP